MMKKSLSIPVSILLITISCSKQEIKPTKVFFTQSEFQAMEADGVGYIEVGAENADKGFFAAFKFEPGSSRERIQIIETGCDVNISGDPECMVESTTNTGRIKFRITDDTDQEADQIVTVRLVYPQDNSYKSFFGSSTIDEARNVASLRIVSDEKIPQGMASFKINGVDQRDIKIKTGKSYLASSICDAYLIQLETDDCTTGCTSDLTMLFPSMPEAGRTYSFFNGPFSSGTFPPDKVYSSYKKWANVESPGFSGSVYIVSNDLVNKTMKLTFSGKFIQNDGSIVEYNIAEGSIDLSLYDFNSCK